MRVLGIDPGLRLTGYACIEWPGGSPSHVEPRLVEGGVFDLSRIGRTDIATDERASTEGEVTQGLSQLTTPKKRAARVATISARLVELERDLREAIGRLSPSLAAVEGLFAHYKHPATAIAMGHARGVILLTIRRAGLELVELKPNAVKKSLTGHGHASKEQMQEAVRLRLGMKIRPEPADVADAIALALVAGLRRGA